MTSPCSASSPKEPTPTSAEALESQRRAQRVPALQLLSQLGGALWALCYAWGLWVGATAGALTFPPLVTALNVSWEFAFAILWPPANRVSRITYRVWLALDAALLLEALLWGSASVTWPLARAHFPLLLAGGVLAALGAQVVLYRALQAPQLQAYLVNLIMSVGFLWAYLTQSEGLVFAPGVAWLKLLGTTCISAANVYAFLPEWRKRWPGLALFALIFALDASYVGLVMSGAPSAAVRLSP